MALKHTVNHIDCPACNAYADAEHGSILNGTWPFDRAAVAWFQSREAVHKTNTLKSYKINLARLTEFFGSMTLASITIANIRAYQRERLERAGATLINAECSTLQQIMKEAGCWTHLGLVYRPLPIKKEKARQAMGPEEEALLVKFATDPRTPRRHLAGHCLIVMMSTTMGFMELRHLRRKDVEFDAKIPVVIVNREAGGAKNDYRERTIPLNFHALRSMKWLVERWKRLGGTEPDQYLLPHRAKNRTSGWDFSQPIVEIRRAAKEVLRAAGLEHLTPYDMRSHAITKLLSDPKVAPQVAQEIAGHISKRMQDRYSRQRVESKKLALDSLGSGSLMEKGAYEELLKATSKL